MKKLILIIFVFISASFAQDAEKLFETMKEKYSSFEYREVILLSNQIIKTKDNIGKEMLIETFMLRAVAYYTTGFESAAEHSFKALLDIDNNYSPDPSQYSPKIIEIFDKVKSSYEEKEKIETTESLKKAEEPVKEIIYVNVFEKESLIRSLLLPGWGHLYNGDRTKGWLLTSAGVISLGSMFYFIFDSNSKEKKYLNETNIEFIGNKYDDYNSSYKLRNISIGAYVAIWLYSQLDLLIFSETTTNQSEPFSTSMDYNPLSNSVKINFKIGL